MADKHEELVSKFRDQLRKKKYLISKKSPLVDYRPDIYAKKNKEEIFAEIEIDQSIYNDHTLGQLSIMYNYVKKNKNYKGFLVIPKEAKKQALFLISSIFDDDRIKVVAL